MLMLDLFAGLGGASAAMRRRGWDVVTVIENVRGAIRWLRPFLGEPKQSHGPFFLWGSFPPFKCRVRPFKESLSSARRAERAKVPEALSTALALAIEAAVMFTEYQT